MATYTIIGGDQKPYNLVTEDNIRAWIAEGRLNAQSLIKVDGQTEFRPLSEFSEFADALAASMAPAPPLAAAPPAISAQHNAAADSVRGPAIALIVVASLGLAYFAFNGLVTLITGNVIAFRHVPPQWQEQIAWMKASASVWGVYYLMAAVLHGFILIGAVRMLQLKNHTLAMIAAIVAMIPCQCCCVLGLPFGIWALVALSKPDVKSQFT